MHYAWVTEDRNALRLGYRGSECVTPGLPRIGLRYAWVTEDRNALRLGYRGSECVTPGLPRMSVSRLCRLSFLKTVFIYRETSFEIAIFEGEVYQRMEICV